MLASLQKELVLFRRLLRFDFVKPQFRKPLQAFYKPARALVYEKVKQCMPLREQKGSLLLHGADSP